MIKIRIAAACLLLTGCSLFTRENAKTANEIAHDLCVKHFSSEKPGVSLKDVELAYCKDLQPWVDTILAAETLGAAKVSAKANQ